MARRERRGYRSLLLDRGVALNGVLLISTIMNFQTARFAPGNDLPLILILPSYTATSWYHKKLSADLQRLPLRKVLDEAEKWAINEYQLALSKGDRLSGQERQKVVKQMSRYTGISEAFIENCDLRVELSKSEQGTAARSEAHNRQARQSFHRDRFARRRRRANSIRSMTAIRPPYTAAFNDYVRRDLGFKNDSVYHILGGGFTSPWNWNRDNTYADTSVALKSAFSKNPFMKLFIAYGYYDMATPYFAAEYTIDHMNLDPSLKANIKTAYYEAGHMMYIDVKSLAKLKQDVAAFIQSSISGK